MKTFLCFILCLLILLLGGWLWPLPYKAPAPTVFSFYDKNGALLYKESGVKLPATELPEPLKEWIVVLEDKNFETHSGVDLKALTRAVLQNLKSGEVVSGASTITMQLARLQFLETHKRDWWYKIQQSFWALKLEQKLTKDGILERYLQSVSLGHNVIGFSAGAQFYFSKDLDQLSVAELATLLAIVQNPSLFNPLSYPERALERRNLILQRLQSVQLISNQDYAFWVTQPITLQPQVERSILAPHFVFWVKKQLETRHFSEPELQVHTTLDKTLYEDARKILTETISREQQTKKINNGAIVVLDEQNQVQVMLGSPDFFNSEIDGAINMATAPRQTGSVLKPFLYVLALQKGWSPAEALNDQKTIFPDGYLPRNFNVEEENGRVRFREALANSYNIAAVDLLNRLGVSTFYVFLESFGFQFKQPAEALGLSLVLGSAEASLLTVTHSYSAFTHQGNLSPLQFVTAVKTPTGEMVYTPEIPAAKKLVDTNTAEWAQQVLSDKTARWKNFSRGNSLELEFPSGAKTGTSQAFRDNWVIGFSPRYTVGVWVGNADGTPMVASSGMQGAGPVWQKIMQLLHRNQGARSFTYQGNRRLKTVCRRPGQIDCSEKVPVFLTPEDEAKLEREDAFLEEDFKIVYPTETDVFAAGSDVLLKVRGTQSSVQYYKHNGVISDSPIFENLTVGSHVFEAVNLDGKTAIVQILVEEL